TLAEKGRNSYQLEDANEWLMGYMHHTISYPLSDYEFNKLKKQSVLYDIEGSSQDIIGKTVYYLNDAPIEEASIYAERLPKKREDLLSSVLSIYEQIVGIE